MLPFHLHNPNMLANLFYYSNTVSFSGCMTQLITEHFLGASEIFLLVTKACDHYVAICWPLHYVTLLNHHMLLPIGGVLGSEFSALKWTYPGHFLPSILWFQHHGSLHMWHSPPDTIAYTDSFLVHLLVAANRGVTPVINFVMLFVFYVVLLCFLRTHNSAGRKKPWLPIVLTSQLSCSLCLYFNVSVTCNNLFHE